jgi:hypothetical protein
VCVCAVVSNFWAKEWMLLLIAFVVFVFDVICCVLIYSAVQDNNRASGWGPRIGEAALMQHSVTGDHGGQFDGR